MNNHKFIRTLHAPHGANLQITTLSSCDDKCLIDLFQKTIVAIRKGEFLIVDVANADINTNS